jgi:hypothetical protein
VKSTRELFWAFHKYSSIIGNLILWEILLIFHWLLIKIHSSNHYGDLEMLRILLLLELFMRIIAWLLFAIFLVDESWKFYWDVGDAGLLNFFLEISLKFSWNFYHLCLIQPWPTRDPRGSPMWPFKRLWNIALKQNRLKL